MIPSGYRVAYCWERGVAVALDSIVVSWAMFAVLLVVPVSSKLAQAALLVVALGFVAHYVYFLLVEGVFQSVTPGKRIAGLLVLSATGQPANRAQLAVRNALRIVDMLPLMYFIGLISAASDSLGRRLGDRLARTVVAKKKGRGIALKPAVLLVLSVLLLQPLAVGVLIAVGILMNPPFIEPPTVPLPARLEVRVLSAQPIVIDGRSNLSIDLEVTNVGDVPAAGCSLDLVGLPGYLGRPTSKDLVIGDVEAGASLQKTVVFQVAWEAEGEGWVVLRVVWKDGSSGSVKVRVLP